jgi:hypothetical protein
MSKRYYSKAEPVNKEGSMTINMVLERMYKIESKLDMLLEGLEEK